jgi:chemotaxis protein methyltransferase CheR
LDAAEEGEPAATRRLLALLTTKFTGFFRHPVQLNRAAEHVLRTAREDGNARVWSAAAASGEEPYSLAITLLEISGQDAPPLRVVATDVDADALEIALRGEYNEAAMAAIQPELGQRFFSETEIAGRWKVRNAVRTLVAFSLLNLVSEEWPIEGPFAVILCRNVLMYLEPSRRVAVLTRMAGLLRRDGLLILDPTEHLGPAAGLFTPGVDSIYSLKR